MFEARKEGSARKGRVSGEEVTGIDRGLVMKHLMDHSKDAGLLIPVTLDPVLQMLGLSVQGSES